MQDGVDNDDDSYVDFPMIRLRTEFDTGVGEDDVVCPSARMTDDDEDGLVDLADQGARVWPIPESWMEGDIATCSNEPTMTVMALPISG